MAERRLPTGEEPPKGYEQLVAELKRSKVARVERVAATQLTSLEVRELESLRKHSIERIRETVKSIAESQLAPAEVEALRRLAADRLGISVGEGEQPSIDFTFEREVNLWPAGTSPSDKLTYRAYRKQELVGYALVVRAWPTEEEWTIQHLIIDPEQRLQGVGFQIVTAIEEDALATTESTRFINAVPITAESYSFWEFMRYEPVGDRRVFALGSHALAIQPYRKAIR